MIWVIPDSCIIFVQATPAAPVPSTRTRRLSIGLPTIFRELKSAAMTTTAVPCWSSWKTGMSSSALSVSSISKQRGAEMSSRLIPPKVGASSLTVWMISPGSLVSRQIGNALALGARTGDQVDGLQRAAGLRNLCGQLAERLLARVELDADGDAVLSGGSHGALIIGGSKFALG